MKKILYLSLLLALATFACQAQIAKCYLSFNKATGLKMATPERLPETSDKVGSLTTANGSTHLTILDGYRILYLNKKKEPFVNVKVELSDAATYLADQQKVLDNLRYLNANSAGMESKDLIEINYNGYRIYGLSRAGIDSGSTLGTFVMFPGNNTIVYFYFNNIDPAKRNFKDTEDYKGQRNNFLGEYTSHLNNCKSS